MCTLEYISITMWIYFLHVHKQGDGLWWEYNILFKYTHIPYHLLLTVAYIIILLMYNFPQANSNNYTSALANNLKYNKITFYKNINVNTDVYYLVSLSIYFMKPHQNRSKLLKCILWYLCSHYNFTRNWDFFSVYLTKYIIIG